MIDPKRPPGGAPDKTSLPRRGGMPRWFLLILIAAVAYQTFSVWGDAHETRTVSYREMRDGIVEGRFGSVMITDQQLIGTLAEPGSPPQGAKERTLEGAKERPSEDGQLEEAPQTGAQSDDSQAEQEYERWRANRVPEDEGLVELLEANDVDYAYESPSSVLPWLVWGLGGLLLFGFLMRRATSTGVGPQQVLQIGRSKARIHVEPDTGVSFEDVAGADEAIEELRELVSFLREPERYEAIGARIPKGVLLMGPPGTGKTLLARAVAGHARVPFLSLSGSEFMEMFVGVGAARVRDLFAQAAAHAPAIIFIDELDALAKSRGGPTTVGGHDEREQTLNQLLSEMDGFNPRARVIVLAATNRPEVLDPAVLRPGRFDRQIVVDKPSRAGRRQILAIHTRDVQLDPTVELDRIAANTSGMAGADLANIVNEAALLAVRRGAERVAVADFEEAIEREMAGLRRKGRRLSDREKARVACHESGHAVVSLTCEHADPLHKISLVSRGAGALGYTMQVPSEDRTLLSEGELRDRLAVLLGGRAAEALFLESLSTGAADDLRKATELARAMVVEYGMSDALGPVSLRRAARGPFLPSSVQSGYPGADLSDHTAQRVDREVELLIEEAEQRARQRLERHQDLHGALVERLLEHDVIGHEDIATLTAAHGVPMPGADRGPSRPAESQVPLVYQYRQDSGE